MSEEKWCPVLTVRKDQDNFMIGTQCQDQNICVVSINGEYHAMVDECPHQGANMSTGYIKNGHVYCAWHDIGFDPKTGEAVNYNTNIKTFPVKIEQGKVYIKLSESDN